jgi:hypothetical protein
VTAYDLVVHAMRIDDECGTADEANAYVAAHDLVVFLPEPIRPGEIGAATDRLRWIASTTAPRTVVVDEVSALGDPDEVRGEIDRLLTAGRQQHDLGVEL